MENLYGNSLEFCVKAIAEKEVSIENILYIISDTKFITPQAAIEYYKGSSWPNESYWDICTILWPKVIQPRFISDEFTPYGDEPHFYSNLDELVQKSDTVFSRLNPIRMLQIAGDIK